MLIEPAGVGKVELQAAPHGGLPVRVEERVYGLEFGRTSEDLARVFGDAKQAAAVLLRCCAARLQRSEAAERTRQES